ncbi:hypothetical protein ISS86_02485 [Candidatus Microgenomates bacterium]|nr:hypothetical protein [Candidatus Microgenomates bacterium]
MTERTVELVWVMIEGTNFNKLLPVKEVKRLRDEPGDGRRRRMEPISVPARSFLLETAARAGRLRVDII